MTEFKAGDLVVYTADTEGADTDNPWGRMFLRMKTEPVKVLATIRKGHLVQVYVPFSEMHEKAFYITSDVVALYIEPVNVSELMELL